MKSVALFQKAVCQKNAIFKMSVLKGPGKFHCV